MAITYFGVGANPTDLQAGGNGNSGTVIVVPPGSMLAGDLAIFLGAYNGNGVTGDWNAMTGNGDGQSWNDLSINHGTPFNYRAHWCQFNGTWSANPRDSYHGTVINVGISGLLVVFRPTSSGTLPWVVDATGGESTASFTAPTTPFDVTTTGQTPTNASTVSVAIWASKGNPTYALQTGGWTNPSATTQWRNPYGTAPTFAVGYKIQTSAAATGNVTNRQSATGFAGWKTIITFAEAASASPTLSVNKDGGFAEMQGGFAGA